MVLAPLSLPKCRRWAICLAERVVSRLKRVASASLAGVDSPILNYFHLFSDPMPSYHFSDCLASYANAGSVPRCARAMACATHDSSPIVRRWPIQRLKTPQITFVAHLVHTC